jgi:hypothetical protein
VQVSCDDVRLVLFSEDYSGTVTNILWRFRYFWQNEISGHHLTRYKYLIESSKFKNFNINTVFLYLITNFFHCTPSHNGTWISRFALFSGKQFDVVHDSENCYPSIITHHPSWQFKILYRFFASQHSILRFAVFNNKNWRYSITVQHIYLVRKDLKSRYLNQEVSGLHRLRALQKSWNLFRFSLDDVQDIFCDVFLMVVNK